MICVGLIHQDNNVYAASSPKTLGTISLGNSSVVQVKSADVFSQEKGLYLIYTLSYTNKGNTTLQLNDYWTKVKNTSGKSYTTSIIEKDKKVTAVNSKSTVDITYYVPIDETMTLSKLIITVVKWDFSVPNYTRTLGSFNLANYSASTVAAFQPKYLVSKESKLKTAVKSVKSTVSSAATEEEEDQRTIDISFLFENQNTREFRPSNIQFYLITKDGSLFKVNSDSLKDMTIQPKERKIVTLKSTLPIVIKEDGLKLILGNFSESDGLFIPLASFQVPKSGNTTTTTSTATNKKTYGDYEIEILGYHRLPNGSQDILTAVFKVTNKSKTAVKVPNLKAKWTLNDIVQTESDGDLIAYDQRVQLVSEQSIMMVASLQVPYTAQLDDIKVNLREKLDAQNESVIGLFVSKDINKFQVVSGNKVEFDRLAAKASLEILRVRSSLEGKQINVSGDLAITNLETRFGNLQKYEIFLQDKSGQIYPLKLAEYTKSIISNGRVLIPFSGKVSASAEGEVMNLLISEMIPMSSGEAQSKTVTGQVVSLNTAWPNTIVKDKFNNLAVGKFDISMDKLYAYLSYSGGMNDVQGLNLEMEYSMLADTSFDDVAGPYKLRVEIEDQSSTRTVIAKEYELGDDSQEFKEGQNIKKTLLLEDSKLLDKVQIFRDYKLSIYVVANEQKVLVAQRVMPYFQINWLENL